jgi:hypothetical protein
VNKGGTWAGATEQLDKLKFVPVYVRSTGEPSAGLDALRSKGAIPWPNPPDVDAFEGVFDVASQPSVSPPQAGLALFSGVGALEGAPETPSVLETASAIEMLSEPVRRPTAAPSDRPVESGPKPSATTPPVAETPPEAASPMAIAPATSADTLFATVREVIQQLLKVPMKDAEVAAVLDVSNAQAKAWLQRLVDKGVIEKLKKPARYIVKQSKLFEGF